MYDHYRPFLYLVVVIGSSFLAIEGNIGFGVLGCWRDHPNTKSSYTGAIATINRYIGGEVKAPGDVLRVMLDVIWPSHDVSPEAMYCFDEEIHGSTSLADRKKYSNILDGFKAGLNVALELTNRNPRDPAVGKALQNIHINASFWQSTFLQVVDIEKGSLYFREFSLLLLGTHGELINFHKAAGNQVEVEKWKGVLADDCYILAKYSYWFLRFMPKKMADNIIFDQQKFGNNQLGFVNQVNAKRLNEYDEPLAKCAANDNNACSDYAMGFLKSVRISHRKKVEEYWKDILHDFRRLLFQRHCVLSACKKDRYDELFIHVGEPVGLQFQASNAEGGKFCGSNFCSNMWLSAAGYRDYVYYRGCLGDSPVELTPSQCPEDIWTICTKRGGCNREIILTNDYFPLTLRSAASGMCIDCSATSTWCKQAVCPTFVHDTTPVADAAHDPCDDGPENCKGPQFQVHNFERGVNEPLEIFDEVHFSYASKKEGTPKFLTGDIYSGAFLRTQYYMRLEDKFSFTSKKTGATSGPFTCSAGSTWSMMDADERAACAQSSFTLFKKIDPASITSKPYYVRETVQTGGSESSDRSTGQSDRQIQNVAGGPRDLADEDAPVYPYRDRNLA